MRVDNPDPTTAEGEVDVASSFFNMSVAVKRTVVPLAAIGFVLIASWVLFFNKDVSQSKSVSVQITASPTMAPVVVQPPAVLIQRSADAIPVPTDVPVVELPVEEPEDLAPFVSASGGEQRSGRVLLITNIASDITTRRASAAQIDAEFPELVGVPKLTAEDLDVLLGNLNMYFGSASLSLDVNDPNKLGLDQAAWAIRSRVSNDMALHGFYAGFMENARNREFAALNALSFGTPETLVNHAADVARASHVVEAAIIFLNPISGEGSYTAIDQNLLSESIALLSRLRNLNVSLLQAAAPKPLPTAVPAVAVVPFVETVPEVVPVPDASAPSMQSAPQVNPARSAFAESNRSPINLNTPAQATSLEETDATQPQVCEGPILVNGELVVGVMPVNLVNWFLWGKSHLGGGAYTRPMYEVVQIIPYDPAPVDLINGTPIVVDFPVVEYLLQKTLGEGPDLVSFYATDEGYRKLTEIGVAVGRLVSFSTILGYLGP